MKDRADIVLGVVREAGERADSFYRLYDRAGDKTSKMIALTIREACDHILSESAVALEMPDNLPLKTEFEH